MVQLKARATKGVTRKGAPWLAPGLLAGAVLLGACAGFGPADDQTTRIYQGVASDALYDRTLQALQASGLEITEADRAGGVITAAAQFDQRDWATCPDSLMLVNDQGGEAQMVDAPEDHREVELTASVTDGPQGARLTLDPAFVTEPLSAMATTEAAAPPASLKTRFSRL